MIRRLHEWLHAIYYGDYGEGHPRKGYDSKIERWREYPYEPDAHREHHRTATMAEYGAYRVFYCYTCEHHYRRMR